MLKISNIINLFVGFFKVGLFSVGGGYVAIPLIEYQIVKFYKLMPVEEFADLVAIAETTPGPISINSATFVGNMVAGIPGALISTLACIIPSFIICLLLAKVYYKYKGLSGLQLVLASLRPAVVALIASSGMSILALAVLKRDIPILNASFSDFKILESILFIIAFFLLRKFKLNPILVIFGVGIIGTIIHFIIF